MFARSTRRATDICCTRAWARLTQDWHSISQVAAGGFRRGVGHSPRHSCLRSAESRHEVPGSLMAFLRAAPVTRPFRPTLRRFRPQGGRCDQLLAPGTSGRIHRLVPRPMRLRRIRNTAKRSQGLRRGISDRVPLGRPMAAKRERASQRAVSQLHDPEVPHGMDHLPPRTLDSNEATRAVAQGHPALTGANLHRATGPIRA